MPQTEQEAAALKPGRAGGVLPVTCISSPVNRTLPPGPVTGSIRVIRAVVLSRYYLAGLEPHGSIIWIRSNPPPPGPKLQRTELRTGSEFWCAG
ncbi:MAG TPA: hypothetical protein VGX23_17980 [Actinocrinis sp.]|nr:hypothetical protein [Actinocrinis sp.]